jgi:hypothetical protein
MKLHISNVNELGLTQKWLMYFLERKKEKNLFFRSSISKNKQRPSPPWTFHILIGKFSYIVSHRAFNSQLFRKDFICCQPRLKKTFITFYGIHGNPAKRDLR